MILEDLSPGPYSDYILGNIGPHSRTGPIREELVQIQERWQESFGDNPLYAKNLQQLNECLNSESKKVGLLDTLKSLIGIKKT